MLLAELSKFGERGCGFTGVNSLCAHGNTLLEVSGEAGSDEAGGGVQKHDVAARAGNAGQNVIKQRRIRCHIASGKVLVRGAGQASHFGRDARRFQRRRTFLGLLNACHDGLAAGCELVDSIGSMDHVGPFGT